VLVVFEGLHWFDTETQAVLDRLVDSLSTARVFLLTNYRPEYQHGRDSKTYYSQFRLDPLPPASAEELLQTLLGHDVSLQSVKPRLAAQTQGNPFFLEESVRTLMETGVLVGERGAYHLAKPVDSLQVPARVQAVLAARIDRLSPEEKRVLQTAVVIGTGVPWLLLQAIDLRLALRSALLTLGDFGRILGALREAEALAEHLDDPRRLAQVSLFLSAHFRNLSTHDQAIATAQRAHVLAMANGDILRQAPVESLPRGVLPGSGQLSACDSLSRADRRGPRRGAAPRAL
jgi:hypothetical protein